MTDQITYRPLHEADLPRMADWLNRPHLRAFYQRQPISAAEVSDKYLPRIRRTVATLSSIAERSGAPFGYLQCAAVSASADWQAMIGVDQGVSVDLFIGEPDLLGRSLGRRMLAGYVDEVVFALHPNELLCWIGHELANVAAQRCSAAAGFAPVRSYLEDGRPSVLMVRQRRAGP